MVTKANDKNGKNFQNTASTRLVYKMKDIYVAYINEIYTKNQNIHSRLSYSTSSLRILSLL